MKKILLFSMLVVIILNVKVIALTNKDLMEDFYGVWANKDCELVQTSKYWLYFEKDRDNISASLSKIEINDTNIFFKKTKTAFFNTENQDADIKSNRAFYHKLQYEKTKDKIILKEKKNIIFELSLIDSTLKFYKSPDDIQTLKLVEKLSIVAPYDMPLANKDNIGECLEKWSLGVRYSTSFYKIMKTLTIETPKHSYIFSYADLLGWTPYIYCRAARIKSNNMGTVFAQNIRMQNLDLPTKNFLIMKFPKKKGHSLYMAENNYETTKTELVIQDSLFNPDSCVFTDDLINDGIYWGTKTFNDSLITISGCGQSYYRYRPKKNAKNIFEWFRYSKELEK